MVGTSTRLETRTKESGMVASYCDINHKSVHESECGFSPLH